MRHIGGCEVARLHGSATWHSPFATLCEVRPRCWGGVSSGESMATASVTPGRARGCMRHAACGTHPNDDHVRVTSGPDAVSRTRLCREVCRFRTGGAPSAKAVHGLCGGCHPRPAGRTSWMHHGVCRRMWIRRLRWRPHAASCSTPGGGPGAVITLRRGDVRPVRTSHGPRGPAAVILSPLPPRTSVRASFGPVPVRKVPDAMCRACRARCPEVWFGSESPSTAAPVYASRRERPSRPVPHGRR